MRYRTTVVSESLPSISRVPARVVLASIAGLWLCYFTLATLRGWVIGFELDWAMFSRRVVVTVASMAATALLWPILQLMQRRPIWQQAVAVMLAALPCSLLLAGINHWVFADIESQVVTRIGDDRGISIRRDEAGNVLVDLPRPDLPDLPSGEHTARQTTILLDSVGDDENRWRQMTDLALGRYFLLLAWAALYLALLKGAQARGAERREGEYRRAAKAAELRSLRYQVNPHFLFNTLNSLSALVLTGRAEGAERMIQTISTFYRRSLTQDPTTDHPLSEEIALQQLYLEIEAVRFPDRLRSRFEIPSKLAGAMVPGMILQPLIENSVKYAVAASKAAVTITVVAREEAGILEISVSDDGPGSRSGKTGDAAGVGIGLANVRDRLMAGFGTRAGLRAGPAATGYCTTIWLPLVSGRG